MITIITPCFNNAATIAACLASIYSQTYEDYEHIIIDGGSTDNTLDIINLNVGHNRRVISESDKGPYDAMNKGIALASGDVVGILNADDIYADNLVLERIVNTFKNSDCDACYGDLVYVQRENPDKSVRYWRSGEYNAENLRRSWIPPHPTFYVRRDVYSQFGLHDLCFRLAADYELMLRMLLRYEIKLSYINAVLVKMRLGGLTNRSFGNLICQNIEIIKARRMHGLRSSAVYLVYKVISRFKQYVCRLRSLLER